MIYLDTEFDIPKFIVCDACKNLIKGKKCKAFDIIPDEILTGKNDHSKPLPNQDNDTVFEKKLA